MGNEPKDGEPRDSGDDEPAERPTVVPAFDPAALARRTAGSSPVGAPRDDGDGERTLVRTARPPDIGAPEATQLPDQVRSSLLSMADSRVPSVKPAPQRIPSLTGLASAEVDRGWEELTLDEPRAAAADATGRTSDGPFRRETSRLRFPSAERVAAEEEEKPTRERPIIGELAPLGADDHTVFSPARAKAALTAPSNRPKPVSEPPVPGPEKPAASVPASPEETIREMRDRFSLGDYTGALVLADGILDDDPGNAEVKECAEKCRQVLRQMYTARIGPLDRVPMVTVARDQLRWLSIDHRAGFILSHIDGISSLEMILDVSGMPILDALRILCELAQQRIISFR